MVDAGDGKIRLGVCCACGPTTKAVAAVEVKKTMESSLIMVVVDLAVDIFVFRPRREGMVDGLTETKMSQLTECEAKKRNCCSVSDMTSIRNVCEAAGMAQLRNSADVPENSEEGSPLL